MTDADESAYWVLVMPEPFHNPWTKSADSLLSRVGSSISDGVSKSTSALARNIGHTWGQMREDAPEANLASRAAFWLADGAVNAGVKGFQGAQKGMEKTLDAYVPKGEGVRYSDGRNRRTHGQGPDWAQAVDGAWDLWGGAGNMALAGASVVPVRMGGNLATNILPKSLPSFLGISGARTLGAGMLQPWSPLSRTAGRWGMNIFGNTIEAAFSPGVSASRLANWATTKGGTNPFVRTVDWLFNKAPILKHLKRLGQRTLGDGTKAVAPYGSGITGNVWKSFVQRPGALPTHLGKSLGSSLLGPGNFLPIYYGAKGSQGIHDSYYGQRDDWGPGRSLTTTTLSQAPYLLANSMPANLAAYGFDEIMDRLNKDRIPNLSQEANAYVDAYGELPTNPVSWAQGLLTPSGRDRIPRLTQQGIDRLPPDLGSLVAHKGTYSGIGREVLAQINSLINQGYPPEDVYNHVRQQYRLKTQ